MKKLNDLIENIEKYDGIEYLNRSEVLKTLKLAKKEIIKQLPIQGVVESALTTKDLIVFAKWIDDKFYSHRLKFLQSDLETYYMENRESILKRYS